MSHPKTTGGRNVKRGDTFDVECSRTSTRLRMAHAILKSQGAEPVWSHSDRTRLEFGWLEKHACDHRCTCAWPEWVTGEAFDLAYRLADEIQTARGAHNRRGMKV